MKCWFVHYKYVSGETELPMVVLICGSGPARKLIHEYFSKYWWFGTKCEKRCDFYWNSEETEAVRVESWHEVPPEDAQVLERYLPYELVSHKD